MRTVAALLALAAVCAHAQPFPAKPIRLIVPWPPGGGTDALARAFAPKLAEAIGQQIVIDNRAGASGIIGTEQVAKADADGYTLLWTAPSHTTVTATTPKLPFDAIKSFVAVAQVASTPLVAAVTPSLAANSAAELVQLARAKPNEVNYASSGNGSINHLAGELFRLRAAAPMTHVAYKGIGPATTDLLAGRVHVLFASIPSVLPHARAGKLRILATLGDRRAGVLPDSPTLAEAGLAPIEVYGWWGVLAPAGTPREIIVQLNAAAQKALAQSDLRERLATESAEPTPGSPERFAEFIARDLAMWRKLVAEAGIKLE